MDQLFGVFVGHDSRPHAVPDIAGERVDPLFAAVQSYGVPAPFGHPEGLDEFGAEFGSPVEAVRCAVEIQDALKTTGGNCARAAKLLNTTERILGYRIKKYAIACDRLRR